MSAIQNNTFLLETSNFSSLISQNPQSLSSEGLTFFDIPPPPHGPGKPYSRGNILILNSDLFDALTKVVIDYLSLFISKCGWNNFNSEKNSSPLQSLAKEIALNLKVKEQSFTVYPLQSSSFTDLKSQLEQWSKVDGLSEQESTSRSIAMTRILTCVQSNNPTLKLNGLDITSLPDCIGNLTHLTSLDLGWSSIKTLPKSFGKLTKLQILNLSPTPLETLPDSFCELTSLVQLKLQTNCLISLPPSFGKLTSLTELYLMGQTRRTSLELPDSFCQLTRLVKLSLFGNLLTSLPKNFDQLTQLREIDLGNNKLPPAEERRILALIKERKDKNLSSWARLSITVEDTRLEIADLEKLVPEAIKNNLALWSREQGLNEAEVHGRKAAHGRILTCVINKESSLNLKNLGLTTLPDCIGNLTALQEMDLSNNQLKLLPSSVGALLKLTKLDLSENQLAILPDSIGELINLVRLDLSKNKLQLLPESIGRLINLGKPKNPNSYSPFQAGLDLSENLLKSLPESFGNLTNLVTLNLADNELESLPQSIKKLTKLWGIYLQKNRLKTLPANIGNLVDLQGIYLSENQLEFLPDVFDRFTKMTQLLLDQNQLLSLPDSICKMAQLKKLDVSKNQLQYLPKAVGDLKALTLLRLSDNELENLPPSIGNLCNLIGLDVVRNQLSFLPATIVRLVNLRILSIVGNQITVVPKDFNNLSSLRGLYDGFRDHQFPMPESLDALEKLVDIVGFTLSPASSIFAPVPPASNGTRAPSRASAQSSSKQLTVGQPISQQYAAIEAAYSARATTRSSNLTKQQARDAELEEVRATAQRMNAFSQLIKESGLVSNTTVSQNTSSEQNARNAQFARLTALVQQQQLIDRGGLSNTTVSQNTSSASGQSSGSQSKIRKDDKNCTIS